MAFSALSFPTTVTQCGTAVFSWTGGVYPARVELYYQSGTGAWETTGEVIDVYSSPHTFTINVPAGNRVWPTIVGNDGSYNQVNVGADVQASSDDSCLTTALAPTATVTDLLTIVSTFTTTQINVGVGSTRTIISTVTESASSRETPYMDEPLSSSSSNIASANTTSRSEMGASQPLAGETNSSYRTASAVLGALFALACLGILFLLFLLRRTRKRQQRPIRPRIARFTDDASLMSETNSTRSFPPTTASSNPFADPINETPSSPILARAATIKESLGFHVERKPPSMPQRPVSELFLTVPHPPGPANNSESDLSRVGTINSVDERQPVGLQGLYVRNHSQFTLNSMNTEDDRR